MPPAGQADNRGYLAYHQAAAHGYPINSDYMLPGQLNPAVPFNNPKLPPYAHQPSPIYQSHIPSHPPIQQYSPINGPQAYPPQQSPVYGGYGVQYQGYDMPHPHGPPSGGYHHQPRLQDHPTPVLDNGAKPVYSNHPSYSGQQMPQEQYQYHPSYDYGGYLNTGYKPDPANSEVGWVFLYRDELLVSYALAASFLRDFGAKF